MFAPPVDPARLRSALGRRFMRISVSNWSTTEADVDRSVAALIDAKLGGGD